VRGIIGGTSRGEFKGDIVSSASLASRLSDNTLNTSQNIGCLLIARKPANTANVILVTQANEIIQGVMRKLVFCRFYKDKKSRCYAVNRLITGW
jgi:hypothetical protein